MLKVWTCSSGKGSNLFRSLAVSNGDSEEQCSYVLQGVGPSPFSEFEFQDLDEKQNSSLVMAPNPLEYWYLFVSCHRDHASLYSLLPLH